MKITDVTISTVHGELNVSFISILHQHASQPLWKSQFMIEKKVSHEHFMRKKIGLIMSQKDHALYHSNYGWWWGGGGGVRRG